MRLDLGPAKESSSNHAGLRHLVFAGDVIVRAIYWTRHVPCSRWARYANRSL